MDRLEQLKTYKFLVNSFEVEAQYFERDIQTVFIPLLEKFSNLCINSDQRIIVFIAAPPGVGKTTLSLFLEHLSQTHDDLQEVQALGIDGFHYPQAFLEANSILKDGVRVPMRSVKGCPETFDLKGLKSKIEALKERDLTWPIYDRMLHDVVADQILVTKQIVIIEGNYLLLDEEGWRDLHRSCDYSIFIGAQEDLLKERLIQRKVKGGLKMTEAEAFYHMSDGKNVNRVLTKRVQSDIELMLSKNGNYTRGR